MGQIRRVFLNVSMTNRIDGLQRIAEGSGIKLNDLEPGSYLVFVNAAKDKLAMLVGVHNEESRQIMAYKKLEGDRKLDLRVIAEIPRYFDGKRLNYDDALKSAVEAAMARKDKHKKLLAIE